jgi:hypothetical protein
MLNQPSVFSSPEWLTPFVQQLKNPHMYLTDIILQIPLCIGLCNSECGLSTFFASPISSYVNLKPVHERARSLLGELEAWAAQNPRLCYVPGGFGTKSSPTPQSANLSDPSPPQSAVSTSPMLPDTFIALTAATYQATHLILTLLVNKVTPPLSIASVLSPAPEIDAPGFIASPVKQSQSILEIGEYVESVHPVGFDFMRSTFPLMVVAILAPQQEERERARSMLDRWGRRRGVRGLCSVWGSM